MRDSVNSVGQMAGSLLTDVSEGISQKGVTVARLGHTVTCGGRERLPILGSFLSTYSWMGPFPLNARCSEHQDHRLPFLCIHVRQPVFEYKPKPWWIKPGIVTCGILGQWLDMFIFLFSCLWNGGLEKQAPNMLSRWDDTILCNVQRYCKITMD